MTEPFTELLTSDGMIGGLLVVEPWVLGLYGCQPSLYGFIKQVTKHLEPETINNTQ